MKKIPLFTSQIVRHYTAVMLTMAAVVVPWPASASLINDILTNLQDTLTLVLQILMTLAFVVFVWGIIKFIGAAGNPQAVKQAKGIMYFGIIALAILATTTGIIAFLQAYFGLESNTDINVPQFRNKL